VVAIGAALADVRKGLAGPVPPHLRDAHYKGAKKLEHGAGYKYAHDFPGGVVEQQYAPDAVAGRDYYHPTKHGMESRFSEVVDRLRAVLRGARRE
jgi:putative ATPase